MFVIKSILGRSLAFLQTGRERIIDISLKNPRKHAQLRVVCTYWNLHVPLLLMIIHSWLYL